MAKYKTDQILEVDGDKWRIVGVGATNDEGKTYLHLASITRFRQQRNGLVPVQKGDWM